MNRQQPPTWQHTSAQLRRAANAAHRALMELDRLNIARLECDTEKGNPPTPEQLREVRETARTLVWLARAARRKVPTRQQVSDWQVTLEDQQLEDQA